MLCHVLVVDDDRAIRFTVRLVLEGAGYTVSEAPDGTTALERLHESTERMVTLLDFRMPRIDGCQVLEAVAAHDSLAARHAYVLMTANVEADATCAPLLDQLHATVLHKPFDMDQLLNAVAQAAARLDGDEAAM